MDKKAKKTAGKDSTKTGKAAGSSGKNAAKKSAGEITNFVHRVTLKRAAEKNWLNKFDDFSSGDTVNVHVSIKEGEKERVQVYKGVVIKIQGTGLGKTFTVRKISSGVGVERTFPYCSPKIEKVEVLNRGHVRRSRLYFLRELEGRAARLDSDLVISEGDATSVETLAAATDAKASDTKTESKTEAPAAEKKS